ncbi:MAG: sodium bicarbonate transporter family protein [Deltaproteobacteria bacterium]|nr:sodium bicarbonate transporter family protein [Deltaproteobacteria bacterium]
MTNLPSPLERTGSLFGGLRADFRRRMPAFASDFADGVNPSVFAAVLFLFFACLAPGVAFGGLMSVATQGDIGVVEMLVATAGCGVIYALTSAQPLTILGGTGPLLIFTQLLYGMCQSLHVPFLPTYAWVGLWSALWVVVMVATDASSLLKYFTRFTDETFGALISIIFVVQALTSVFGMFNNPEHEHSTALFSVLLALTTYVIARRLVESRRGPYLRRTLRELFADFGPAIAVIAVTFGRRLLPDVSVPALRMPMTFATTSGRPWLVDLFGVPQWIWFAAAVPGFLVALLVYLDQNITVRLVNSPQHKLKKGVGYHQDLFVTAILLAVCSMFGLPWLVAATVRSLSHVRALAKYEDNAQGESVIVGIRENRLSGLLIHVLVGCSLLVTGLMRQVPMAVVYGLFLYMGISSMRGNQFFERLRLWVMDPNKMPDTHYMRQVPTGVIHRYTLAQGLALTVMWVVKSSALGILFPLLIALLVPLRNLLGKLLGKEHVETLDHEEEPGEEEDRNTE